MYYIRGIGQKYKIAGYKIFLNLEKNLKKNLMITQNVSGISFSNQNLYMYITTYIEQYIAQL